MHRRTLRQTGLLALLLLACSTPTPGTAPTPAAPAASGALVEASAPATEVREESTGTPARQDPAPPATPQDALDARRAEAVRAVEAGDLERAHALLATLLVEQYTAEGLAYLAADEFEPALFAADRALTLDPRATEALLLRGEANFLLAQLLIAEGSGGGLVLVAFEDSLESFRAARPDPRALLGASRSARQLDRAEECLGYAVDAERALAGKADPPLLRESVRRTLAEARFLAYVRAKQGSAFKPELVPELFRGAEDALAELLGEAGTDPWVWNKLATLYEFEGRYDDARSTLLRGLDRIPTDGELLNRYASAARVGGGGGYDAEGDLRDMTAGRIAAVEALERLVARHPDVAGAWYALGWERFELALLAPFDARDPAAFERAEADFAAARERDVAWRDASLRYEVVCRAGAGWSYYSAGDLPAAEAAFRSMEESFEGGLGWSVGERLGSGLTGLEFVAAGYSEASNGYEGSLFSKPDFLPRAARIFDDLRKAVPDDANFANNAGFFHRDAATELELLGRAACRAARGELGSGATLDALRARASVVGAPGSAEERAELGAFADATLGDAREHVRQSYDAYRAAVALSPDDVRIVNDMALIAVYYLREDLEHAEELLQRSIALGEAQLAADDLDEQARWELENAWGDAYENLGVLTFHHAQDPAGARAAFERSTAIGPEPRPLITDVYLRAIDGEQLSPAARAYLEAFPHWGEPCAP